MSDIKYTPDRNDPDVSEERLRIKENGPVVTSVPPERQAVEVKPMRYVLGVGIALAIVAMVVAAIITNISAG
ncbi:hypothetical protein [Niveispirillum sp. KHB5.9]|uniref:hypothetical protein n=1 Tax=Niveispirillum sp. KHB5.9 TaxID=3400269 RepID=UPI003A856217